MDRFDEAKLRIKEAIDLVALIESYLPLKPRGRMFVALCPFHAEKSPSFTVYADSQHYYCFGCGKSGDVFTFVMEREGLTFRESMEMLADRAQVSLEGVFSRGDQSQRGPDPFQILGEVRTWMQQMLFSDEGRTAREYLESRSLAPAIEAWGIGYCPERHGALRQFAQSRRLPPSVLEQAGLLRNGREPFAGRVMFPIDDERGRTVGFGGRVLPGAKPRSDGFDPPKYINSPESPFFNKRRVLYGLHQAKQKGSRRIVVMEGYTDVIACHLAGFHGAVAALGTAFTHEHSKKLERYAQEGVVLLFDGDRAGEQAAVRAMRELVNSQVTVKIALMADAKDPADYVVARPGEDEDLVIERRARFADLVDGADDALATWFRLARRRLDFSQPAELEKVGKECALLLSLVENDLRRRGLLQEMARHLAMPPEGLVRMLRKFPARTDKPEASSDDGPTPEPSDVDLRDIDPSQLPDGAVVAPRPIVAAERDLLAVLVHRPEFTEQVDPSTLQSAEVVRLFAMIRTAMGEGRTTRAEVARHVFSQISSDSGKVSQDLRSVFARCLARADEIKDPAAFFAMLDKDRNRANSRHSARGLRQQLQAALAAGDRDTANRLTQELVAQMRTTAPRNSAK